MVLQIFVVGHPLAVGRPLPGRKSSWILKSLGRDFYRCALFNLHVPAVQSLVVIRNLLAVRRPTRGCKSTMADSQIDFFTSPRPLWSTRCNAYSPDSSEKNAIHFPSGDRTDRVPLLLSSVSDSECFLFRRHAQDFSRASNTARCPVGEIPAFKILSAAFIQCARVAGRSRSLAHQCASRCPTLGPKYTIRQIAHTPGRPVRGNRLKSSPCFRSPASPLWSWCISNRLNWPVSDPKEDKSSLQTTRDSLVRILTRNLHQLQIAQRTQYKSASSARRDTSSRRLHFELAHTPCARHREYDRHPPHIGSASGTPPSAATGRAW